MFRGIPSIFYSHCKLSVCLRHLSHNQTSIPGSNLTMDMACQQLEKRGLETSRSVHVRCSAKRKYTLYSGVDEEHDVDVQ